MPSIGTTTFTTRVKNGTVAILKRTAEINGLSPAQLLDLLASALEDGVIDIDNGEIIASNEAAPMEYSDMELRYQELGFERLLNTFERKNYPDNAIRQAIDMIIEQVLENRDYNPKRAREDWGS